ncbi:OprD family outer membrane porin [Pleomorphovibrio marinus]|uniref:OprD family outer membrane porin n=1 Tax=Pleomorphovibrio marinus TaxID=2164132 RepID=UPI000E09E8EA|nr:OprD family outer membrane porin [Pleomorphovibrio marinus]
MKELWKKGKERIGFIWRPALLLSLIWWISSPVAASVFQDSLGRTSPRLADSLKAGTIDFHLRTFVMGTSNWRALTDYFTTATGGGVAYASPRFKGFQVGFSGFFVFQLFEHNLRVPDPTTGNVNRYEILLYDMNDFQNSKDLDRLEHLYISYKNGGLTTTFGRQRVNSPFLNEQDNRMRPNVFSGLTIDYQKQNWEFMGGWYNHVTMRGTVDWYTVSDSYGVYPFGRNVFGSSSSYHGNVDSRGLGLLGVNYHKEKGIDLQIWNYLAENVFSLHYMKLEKSWRKGKVGLLSGLEGFRQYSINKGGNPDPGKAYIVPGENAWGVGARIGLSSRGHEFTFNNLFHSSSGRFLFPREWGRESFYASLPRERFEGNGGVRAYVLKYRKSWQKPSLITNLGIGSIAQPSVENYQLNKYGVPSYYHFTGDVGYAFKGNLEGLELRFLLVNKTSKGRAEVSDKYRINRVDLWNANLVMDYRF